MPEPGSPSFPLLKIHLAREGPGEKRLTHRREAQGLGDRGQRHDPRLEIALRRALADN